MNKLKLVKVNYQEIPSFCTNDDGEFYVSKGVHVIFTYSTKKHKIFIPETYKTMYIEYELFAKTYSVYDLLAFHIYRFLHTNCLFKCPRKSILWYLLRQSNSLITSIRKFIFLLYVYHFKCN